MYVVNYKNSVTNKGKIIKEICFIRMNSEEMCKIIITWKGHSELFEQNDSNVFRRPSSTQREENVYNILNT